MFKNYLITAWRFLKQNKNFASINALGLSIAMAASFIILLFVINEISYNHCHKNRKQIFRALNYYVDFKNTQLGTPYVMDGLPRQGSMSSMYPHFEDSGVKVKVEGLAVDYNFINTMAITILEGREFSEEFGSDLTQSTILNQTAVKQLGLSDPIGKLIGNKTIIGVVKDFNLHSLHTDIPPLMIDMTDRYIQQVAVHFKPGTLNSILPMLESEWEKAATDRLFRYNTIEDITKTLYSSEKNLSTIVSIFALFTLLIAAFGLFGLILYVARTRVKEIGIKKVFGSSGKSIIYSFIKGNFILVSVSALLSVPVSVYIMTGWLNNFSCKTEIHWWVFAIAYSIASTVVLLTVVFHSYRASRINPTEALKYE